MSNYYMKKIIFLFLITCSFAGNAQQYNNNWIDYSKTYYKFKIAKNGLYRINQDVLNNLGLNNTPAEQFQLWRNGTQVRIYTSTPSGPIPSSGYIEFLGVMNDGKPDTKLYRAADYQLSDHYSLETDTASYFLTINPALTNLRYFDAPNNVASNTLSPEQYFMNTKSIYFKDQINNGYAQLVGFYIYSSSYDMGEGYSSNEIYSGAGNSLTTTLTALNLFPGGPTASFKTAAAGVAPNDRNFKVTFNNTVLIDQNMPSFTYLKKQVSNIALSSFTSTDNAQITFANVSATSTDRMVVSFAELTYPSTFNFNNQKVFSFQLPASNAGNYLVIDNFNSAGIAPILYDEATGNRLTGDLSSPGKVKFALPASSVALRNFTLVSEDATNITSINTGITKRNFINFSDPNNQGDYIIISNPILYNNGNGQNFVDQYKAYRASSAGGSYNAKVVNIDELSDQFAYGIKTHPASIKDFIGFSKNTFSQKPKSVFIIGKGVSYNEYAAHLNSSFNDKLNLVPTFGYPGSDILLSSDYTGSTPQIPIGRLSAVNGNEVGNYLQKMKEYEQAQASNVQTIANKAWMKNVLHVIGGKDSTESDLFSFYMNNYKDIIQDTFYGAKVQTFSKTSTAAVQLIAGEIIQKLFNEGLSFIGYFGHSSANLLEFNLSSPDTYNNQGKYPFFNVSGCTAGNNYSFDSARINTPETISEQYVLANQRGSIAFLASSHLGIPPILDIYNNELYKNISQKLYGAPAGKIIQSTIKNIGGDNPSLDFFSRINIEEINLNGDPALNFNSHLKPDYVIEDQLIKIDPAFISVAETKFTANIKWLNIGKAINDSIMLEIKRVYPNGTSDMVYRHNVKAPHYADSLTLNLPIIPTRDKGANKLIITIDADNKVDELSESNNTLSKDFFVFEDEIRPIYPFNYSISTQSNITFYGSTANPTAATRQILFEIDTTELFNSPFKKSLSVNSTGGLIPFNPIITFTDNTVYYWRLGLAPITSGGTINWNNSSFIYLSNSYKGYNQSHYYQFLKNTYQNITFDGTYKFTEQSLPVTATTGNYPPNDFTKTSIFVGPLKVSSWGTNFGTLQFVALNPHTLDPLMNQSVSSTSGLYNSNEPGARPKQFEYYFNDLIHRNNAMNFFDNVPDNYYVFVYCLLNNNDSYNYVDQWKNDASINGNGKSLYNKLTQFGFTKLDSFKRNIPFLFIFKKNDNSFTPIQLTGNTPDILEKDLVLNQSFTTGTIESPTFGPAKTWKALHWKGTNIEPSSPDSVKVEIYGIDNNGNKTKVATVGPARDTSLTFINPVNYPYISLKMINSDLVNATPNQLNYWRLDADYAPEGAVAPNILYTMKDTVHIGQNIDFSLAFKNITETAFDSLKIKFYITDRNNIPHVINVNKRKPLIMGDTVVVNYTIDSKNFPGGNTLFIEFNPDNDQVEQYHFNNFLFKNFYVISDQINPLLDVTFDGVHILNRDIVSARPHITIKLKDESKYQALNDTSLLKVQLRYPDGTLKNIKFDNDTLRFIPANLASGENSATIDYTPTLAGQDNEYQLIVTGKDVSGNQAGNLSYNVTFRVINKAMISNLLNYPNPFTTSTAFVFTVTGSQVPQNLRIQILTITGKVVKEITSSELGNIHIGRNITDYKWNGTDMFGQKLANGVYLYRFLTNLNGKSLERFKDQGDNTDKYFTKGYGKMYLMR